MPSESICSYDGRRVLASYGGENVYLFDVSSTMSLQSVIHLPQPADDRDVSMRDVTEETVPSQQATLPTKDKERETQDEEAEEEEEEEEGKDLFTSLLKGKEKEGGEQLQPVESGQTVRITQGFLQRYQGHANIQTVKEM